MESSSLAGKSSHQTLHGFPPETPVKPHQQQPGHTGPPARDPGKAPSSFDERTGSFLAGPDHYMSYHEYLERLNQSDAESKDGDASGYEEHLNIVEFPVDELITMLACLLTKIIEANDKLHPNHFDNTIAVRQKLKEHKKMKKLEKEQRSYRRSNSTSFTHGGINTTVSHISEDENSDDSFNDEEDELKNKYLANVLAFHGTNVPGITLHAYLTRVLKYCPVTNEVFLSLLVYFDRIAKRANIFQDKKSNLGDETPTDAEQIFVMDSYNIHRLIILGITVSSKFFSDIFYKNLRYAKVGGLPLEELNYLELQFLLLLDFKLMISVEDLQNYGDLLLKFWKREQLAGEIVNRDTPTSE
ncbi:cyclin-domain-containing protein [Metschnikowia bicuspidata var. bicuspidata NRRL YB-4993]|uniref:Cyclin-domain-containing protein n=1 Tax=Metschnikowia bicuspidata var. bicuspidata NRRL YB-4993 TaxID=869754 RepID=A0A1A0HD55_9ASCO|nr:cyclin-domain-containing protein [Metschnikowia bicuspidata var. bicuspidata NRRL YB-4993]OBA21946.1 cyclin-domain-containing protein [Metschnikowia bicuspidata var. bicuspidata NRRL YB-4993]